VLPNSKNYTQGVIPPQAWINETETELSDSEVLTLPGGFKPATRRVWLDHGPLGYPIHTSHFKGHLLNEKKRKDSAGSDDTAIMI